MMAARVMKPVKVAASLSYRVAGPLIVNLPSNLTELGQTALN